VKGLGEKNAERFCLRMDARHLCSFCMLSGVRSAPKIVHFAPKIPGPAESMLRSRGGGGGVHGGAAACTSLSSQCRRKLLFCVPGSAHTVQPEILQLQDLG